MTISILAFDEKTGSYGGAAATGSLCVGGWVLRGDPESGMSASQGSLPSTLWGQDVLALTRGGETASNAVAQVVGRDAGRDHRQLSSLDPTGETASFTGAQSIETAGARSEAGVIVAGNLLSSAMVLDRCIARFLVAEGNLSERLLAGLDAASSAGGDRRGFLSAALLVVSRNSAPLSLRIDRSADPLSDLRVLHGHATSGEYADWAAAVPTVAEPQRGPASTAHGASPDLRCTVPIRQ
ncbi:MAG: DUF1028 domain-containing protein [Pseudomonadota bacterium]